MYVINLNIYISLLFVRGDIMYEKHVKNASILRIENKIAAKGGLY